MKLSTKPVYIILFTAIFFDLILAPWLLGLGWFFKFTLAILPGLFLVLEDRRTLTIIFVVMLAYLRAAGFFNLGIIFLALGSVWVYERYFLVSFFHRSAWQTLVFSGGGIFVLYAALLGLSSIFDSKVIILDGGLLTTIFLNTIAAISFNFITNKFTLKNNF